MKTNWFFLDMNWLTNIMKSVSQLVDSLQSLGTLQSLLSNHPSMTQLLTLVMTPSEQPIDTIIEK